MQASGLHAGGGGSTWGRIQMTTTVLIVDDNALLREIARMAIEVEGWEIVAEASNGREAIDVAYELAPDVIVLDQMMPVLDGIRALPKLRRASPHSRIVMWTHTPGVLNAAMRAGASAFVDKSRPLDSLLIAMSLVAPPRDLPESD
jgi:NarL family two-component system response regulator LiaR